MPALHTGGENGTLWVSTANASFSYLVGWFTIICFAYAVTVVGVSIKVIYGTPEGAITFCLPLNPYRLANNTFGATGVALAFLFFDEYYHSTSGTREANRGKILILVFRHSATRTQRG